MPRQCPPRPEKKNVLGMSEFKLRQYRKNLISHGQASHLIRRYAPTEALALAGL